MPMKPNRPTHFLSLPISDPGCHDRAHKLGEVLLKARPRPQGVDESLMVEPRSLHLTLGIMSLMGHRAASRLEEEAKHRRDEVDRPVQDADISHAAKSKQRSVKSVDDAAKLLRECQQALGEIVGREQQYTAGTGIPIRFDRLESFQTDPTKCRVLYAEPEKASNGTAFLREIGEYLRARFHAAGMLADHNQALTLHCTLMKASARKNKPARGSKHPQANKDDGSDTTMDEDDAIPSATAASADVEMEDAPAVNVRAEAGASTRGADAYKKSGSRRRGRFPKKIPFDASLLIGPGKQYELGWSGIDRVQLCQMGRKDEGGVYVALEEISLFPS